MFCVLTPFVCASFPLEPIGISSLSAQGKISESRKVSESNSFIHFSRKEVVRIWDWVRHIYTHVLPTRKHVITREMDTKQLLTRLEPWLEATG